MANTTKRNVTRESDASVQKTELRRRALVQTYKAEDKVNVTIAPMYKPYFGNAMTVAVNGISVVIPCDGKAYAVPKTHATEALARLYKVNEIVTKKDRMKDISRNLESTPGEINFF